jgi:hypothetical protein
MPGVICAAGFCLRDSNPLCSNRLQSYPMREPIERPREQEDIADGLRSHARKVTREAERLVGIMRQSA